jgi:hypothetical protein
MGTAHALLMPELVDAQALGTNMMPVRAREGMCWEGGWCPTTPTESQYINR